jgi:hypothetical protein
VEVDAVGHEHQIANAIGVRLLSGQVASRLAILGGGIWVAAAVVRILRADNATARLEVKTGARAHQVVGRRSVSQAQLLAPLQHSQWWRCVSHLRNT